MWNYSFLIPSLLVLATLLFFYFTKPRLSIRINRLYVVLLMLEILIIATDILSSHADENAASFSRTALYVYNTAFFVFFLARSLGFFLFSAEVSKQRNRLFLALMSLPFFICEIIAISSFSTGWIFSFKGGIYQRGPFYSLLYYCYLFYILSSLAILLPKAGHMDSNERLGYLSYNLALLAGTVLRRMFPQILLMSTFTLVSVLIIYITFENPDLYLSDMSCLFNKRGLTELLNEQMTEKAGEVLGFVVKNYNHERGIYGGTQMDEGVVQISRYLRQSFSDCLLFYLQSGRFVLVGEENLNWAAIRAQIDDRFKQPWDIDNSSLYLSPGFVILRPRAGVDGADRIISNLTIALELVGCPDSTTPRSTWMDTDSVQRLDEQVDILRVIEKTINRGGVEVFFQPIIDSQTRTLVAAEALARIRDDDGRIIPPNLFIPIAEQSGCIDKLGESVFEKTCGFIAEHDMDVLNLQWINVNLSPIQCMQRDLTKRLTGILESHGVSSRFIHLEITEQSIIDYSLLEAQINDLRNAGFQFVLDDYGSGYSNLTRVKHYPFVNIKLDMEVVWDYYRERDSLLPNIVNAFKQMGFSITAEGIESKEMADVLTDIGCDYLQGFTFDKPMPLMDFVEQYGNSEIGI